MKDGSSTNAEEPTNDGEGPEGDSTSCQVASHRSLVPRWGDQWIVCEARSLQPGHEGNHADQISPSLNRVLTAMISAQTAIASAVADGSGLNEHSVGSDAALCGRWFETQFSVSRRARRRVTAAATPSSLDHCLPVAPSSWIVGDGKHN
jgi:hypothetical protein